MSYTRMYVRRTYNIRIDFCCFEVVKWQPPEESNSIKYSANGFHLGPFRHVVFASKEVRWVHYTHNTTGA